jgi:hypothetical protein
VPRHFCSGTANTGEDASKSKGDDDELKIDMKHPVSLSFELFEARVIGDHIIESSVGPGREGNDMRSPRDDLKTGNVFQRDWRESRLHFDMTSWQGDTTSMADERNERSDETIVVYPSVPLCL